MVGGASFVFFSAVNAATNTKWISTNCGTEDNPVVINNPECWDSGNAPSIDYNLHFTASERTYITNTATKKIATALRFLGGDFVVFGAMKFNSFGYNSEETAHVSIDKRGDWTCERDFHVATKEGATFAFTNRTGMLNVCSSQYARLAAGKNSKAFLVIEEDASFKSENNFSIGYASGSKGTFIQNGGESRAVKTIRFTPVPQLSKNAVIKRASAIIGF